MLEPIGLVVTSPQTSPFDLELLKAHLSIDGDAYNDLLQVYMKAAVIWAEGHMQRSIMARECTWKLRKFPPKYGTPRTTWHERYGITLPRGKCISVAGIDYYSNGVLNTLTGPSAGSPEGGTDYQEDLTGDSGGLLLPNRNDGCWPSVDEDFAVPVAIRFTAGYALAADVPENIHHALLFAVADMMEFRGTSDVAGSVLALAAGGKTFSVRETLLSDWVIRRIYG